MYPHRRPQGGADRDEDAVIAIHGAMLATADDFHGPAAYLALCAVAGLQPTAEGYGLLLVLDADGRPYTAVTCDVDYVRLLLDAWGTALQAGEELRIEVPTEKVLGHIPEWPWMWVGLTAWPAGACPPAGERPGGTRGSGA
ncbi:hypothetical protein [Streptomyces sp. DI166]|uniref:hypothetical protein n=1 Tax=Streptomyces sp. DI166 TaxID=1839783 RepID=UPI00114622D2|nr:hypothetical protein [Streptomyces sp. DI166]